MELPWYIDMYLHTCIPVGVLVGVVCLVAVGIGLRWRWRYWIMIVGYLSFVLCHTVVFRSSGARAQVMLVPFRNYWDVFVNGNLEDMGEIVMNLLLLVPVGMLMGLMRKGIRWYHVVMVCCGFSVCVEILQLVLHRGLCETDDVIHNTLGGVLAFCLVRVIMFVFDRARCYAFG